MMNFSVQCKKRLFAALLFILFLWPLEPLRRMDAYFNSDWLIHVWSISDISKQMTQDKVMPSTVSTPNALLNPVPVFYATKFYPLIAMVSLPFKGVFSNGIAE